MKAKGLKWKISGLLAYPLFDKILGVKVVGKENVPEDGPTIIASNHRSAWDPPVIGFAAYPREVHFIAKQELFNPILGPIIRFYNAHPIKRGTGARGALRTALELLHKDYAVVIFPEGTRNRTERPLLPFRRGIQWVAYHTSIVDRVCIVPTWISGKVGNFLVSFGEPIRPSHIEESRFLDVLRERMLALRKENKRR